MSSRHDSSTNPLIFYFCVGGSAEIPAALNAFPHSVHASPAPNPPASPDTSPLAPGDRNSTTAANPPSTIPAEVLSNACSMQESQVSEMRDSLPEDGGGDDEDIRLHYATMHHRVRCRQ